MKTVSKKRTIWLLSGLATTLLGGALLAGCTNGGTSLDDVVEGGYSCVVTFDTAGGQWSSGATGGTSSGEEGEEETVRMEERKYYVKPNSLLDEASAIKFAQTVRSGYTFNTYWLGSKDANGTVTYDRRWDFANDRVTGDITLYARWMENYSLVAKYGENFSKEKQFTVAQNSEGEPQPLTSLSFISEGITVLGMYEDEGKQTPVTVSSQSPYTPPCSAENRVHIIYVDSIDGSWTIVKEEKDFSVYTNSWLYIMADLDFKGAAVDFPRDYFVGRIEGNNHTVANFTLKQTAQNRNDRYFGLFKEIRNSADGPAQIKNVTFKDVAYSAELTNPQVSEYSAGVLAGRVAEETVIEKVTVTGTFDFAITTKGSSLTENHFEFTTVTNAIGYRFLDGSGNETVDMDKYDVDIEEAIVHKYENELPKTETGTAAQALLPNKEEEFN